MDPQTCWLAIVEAFEYARTHELNPTDREGVVYALRELAEWIERGGLCPGLSLVRVIPTPHLA